MIPIPQHGDEGPANYTDVLDLRVPSKDAPGRFYTVADFHDAYKSGSLTPTDVVEALLPLIQRDVTQRSPHSTAFTESKVELVKQAAAASSERWKEGKQLGILDGVPFAVKDDIEVKGYKRHVGTKKDYTEGKEVETSWCARKVEEQGAVLVGKLNMHELGMGMFTCDYNFVRLIAAIGGVLLKLWRVVICRMLMFRRYYQQQPNLGHPSEPL